jgi:peptidoglycan/LPS O-acetylase OafA/YrhL
LKLEHLTSLTALRFFAALSVFFSHVHFVKGTEYSIFFMEKGYVGVTFFFILSGFILSYSYGQRKDMNKKKFYFTRFARIYPLHFLTLIISLPFVFYNDFKHLLATFPNIFLLQSFIPIKGVYFSANSPSWSISTEMFFYLLFPFLINFNKNKLILISILLISYQITFKLSGGAENYEHALIYISPFSRVLDFILGILLYKLTYGKKMYNKNIMQILALVILFLFVYLSGIYSIPQMLLFDLYFVLPFLLLIYSFSENGGYLGRLLSIKPLVILGESSFAFYLIHHLIIRYINAIDSKITPINVEYRILIAISLSIIGSIILFYKFEVPMKNYVLSKLKSIK